MTEPAHLKFAIFPSLSRAIKARAIVDEAVDGDVELLTTEEDLAHDKIPLHLTMARIGMIFGASLVGGLVLAALAGLAVAGLPGAPKHLLSPYATAAVVVMLGAILGGLAGSISYATRVRDELRRLRTLLHFGHSVLLIESDRDIGEMLHRRGAIQTGTLI